MGNLCISSLVVHTRPTRQASVQQWINTLPETQVYSQHEDNQLVIVVDAATERQADTRIRDIQNQADILSTILIYRYRR